MAQGFLSQHSHRVTHNSVTLAPGDLKLSFILLGQCTHAQMTLCHTQINAIKNLNLKQTYKNFGLAKQMAQQRERELAEEERHLEFKSPEVLVKNEDSHIL